MFSVFGENRLDMINTNATAAEIIVWKQSRKTAECFENLHKSPRGEDQSMLARILEKVWPKGDSSEEQLAFAITVCQTVLNPNNDTIVIKDILKRKVEKNKVRFKELRSTINYLLNIF
ncbi:MAG TPA: hypothetical protein VF455_05350 [Chryseobacterium sp.]